MSEQSISRRHALIAAASIGTAVAVAEAGEGDSSRETKPLVAPAQFNISVTLPDGQVVTLKATAAIIDLGLPAQLLVTRMGVVPTIAGPGPVFEPNQPENGFDRQGDFKVKKT